VTISASCPKLGMQRRKPAVNRGLQGGSAEWKCNVYVVARFLLGTVLARSAALVAVASVVFAVAVLFP
jgi:hypothetical protein